MRFDGFGRPLDSYTAQNERRIAPAQTIIPHAMDEP
jgi:hypothetical protein